MITGVDGAPIVYIPDMRLYYCIMTNTDVHTDYSGCDLNDSTEDYVYLSMKELLAKYNHFIEGEQH
jgi:hypothetical protein